MMTEAEHSSLAQDIEERLRQRFPVLQCRVRPHIDTHSTDPIALLIFELHAATPSIQVAYTIIDNEVYNASTVEHLTAHLGPMLAQRLRSAQH